MLINADNSTYETDGGADTMDRVFLLSYDEALTYLPEAEMRQAEKTASEAGVVGDSDAQQMLDALQTRRAEVAAAAESAAAAQASVTVEEIVTFGAYEQDNDSGNGKEPIEWIVLKVDDGKALLISRLGLDCRMYHSISAQVSWTDCSLRAWLNDEFLSAAFSESQRSAIAADGDSVFILSEAEARALFADDAARCAEPTPYAIANGAFAAKGNGCSWWWLRGESAGFMVPCVIADGSILANSSNVSRNLNVVRPALWIDLSAQWR